MKLADRASWYAFALGLFGAAGPLGLALALAGPLALFRWLGLVAVAGSLAGFAVSLAGRRIERARTWPMKTLREPVAHAPHHGS